MKVITTFILLGFTTVFGYSQNVINDTAIAFTSDQIKFSYSPIDLFSSISVAMNKLVNGQKGIEFFFISKPRQKYPNIKIDSIILKTSTGKILTVNNPFIDTIYSREDGGLSLTTIHLLDKNELEILKQYLITTIILSVDSKQLFINLGKKSQRKFKVLVNTTLYLNH